MVMQSHFQNNLHLPVGEMPNEQQNVTGNSSMNVNIGNRGSLLTRRGGRSDRGGRGRERGGRYGGDFSSTPVRLSPERIVDSPDVSSIHSSEELW